MLGSATLTYSGATPVTMQAYSRPVQSHVPKGLAPTPQRIHPARHGHCASARAAHQLNPRGVCTTTHAVQQDSTTGPGAIIDPSAGEDEEALAKAVDLVKAGWDPEGVFASSQPATTTSGDLFAQQAARRAERQRAAAAAAATQQGDGHAAGSSTSPASIGAGALEQAPARANAGPGTPHPATVAALQASAAPKASGVPVGSPSQQAGPATASTPTSNPATTNQAPPPPPPQPTSPAHPATPLQSTSQPPPTPLSTPNQPPSPPPAPTPPQPPAVTSGIPAAQDSPAQGYIRADLQALLEQQYVGVDLSWPGLSVLNLDPPVLHVSGFLTPAQCQDWMQAAEASNELKASLIGAGNAGSTPAAGSANAYDQWRTSCSMLLDPAVQGRHAALQRLVQSFQSKAQRLLQTGKRAWGKAGRMPAAGQYTYESPQVARYERGQHFLSHEDAYSLRLARQNGFNRHATLLLYLNDVPEGGETSFDHLGLAVRPTQGSLVIFFPAFSSGRPDSRTLHTAQDACDTKWVMQQWVARGFTEPDAAPSLPSTTTTTTAAAGSPPSPTTAANPAASPAQPSQVFKVDMGNPTAAAAAAGGGPVGRRSDDKPTKTSKSKGRKGFGGR